MNQRLITLYVPISYLALLDSLVKEGLYPSRAEAIRFGIRDLLRTHNKFSIEKVKE